MTFPPVRSQRNQLAAVSYHHKFRSPVSASSINSNHWRPPVPVPLTVVGVEAMRTTRRVSSSVCRYACVRHSAETRQRRLSKRLSPPTLSPNVEYSRYVYSHVGAVVLVRFAGVCHIFRCFPPARRSDLQPYQLYLLASSACCLYLSSLQVSHRQLWLTKLRCTLSGTATAFATKGSPPHPVLQGTPATPTRNISKPPPMEDFASL